MSTFLLTALGVLLTWSDGSAWQDKTYYDALFRRVHQEQFADTPTTWPLLKALSVAESGLNPRALSPVGAKGLGQIMDGTWADIVPAYVGRGALRSVWNAPDNAYASGYYLRGLWDQWSAPRPPRDRIALTLASYNAGLGNILAAQKAAGGANLWPDVAAKLPDITGHHSQETLGYVEKVLKIYEQITGASRQMRIKNLLVGDAYAEETAAPTAPPPEAKPSGGGSFMGIPQAVVKSMAVSYVYYIFAAAFGLLVLVYGFRFFDKATSYDTSEELQAGNLAVALLAVAQIFGLCWIIVTAIEQGIGG